MLILLILIFIVLIAQLYLLFLISSHLRTIGENTSGLSHLLGVLIREVSKGVVDPTEWEG